MYLSEIIESQLLVILYLSLVIEVLEISNRLIGCSVKVNSTNNDLLTTPLPLNINNNKGSGKIQFTRNYKNVLQ